MIAKIKIVDFALHGWLLQACMVTLGLEKAVDCNEQTYNAPTIPLVLRTI